MVKRKSPFYGETVSPCSGEMVKSVKVYFVDDNVETRKSQNAHTVLLKVSRQESV